MIDNDAVTRRGEWASLYVNILLIIYKRSSDEQKWKTFFPSLFLFNYLLFPIAFFPLFTHRRLSTRIYQQIYSFRSSFYSFLSFHYSFVSPFARVFLSTFSLQLGPRLWEFKEFRNEMRDEMSRKGDPLFLMCLT